MPRKNPHAVALGRRGGKAKTTKKAVAAQNNGKLGGRPPQGAIVIVLGLDPGTEQSALVGFDGVSVTQHRILTNQDLLVELRTHDDDWDVRKDFVLVIEQVESFGMAVGKETFESVFWSGLFAGAWFPWRVERLPRRPIKLHLCQSARATDSNIRQALLDRFGGSKAVGTKKDQGPLYGIKSHEWAALAVAVTWWDQFGGQNG